MAIIQVRVIQEFWGNLVENNHFFNVDGGDSGDFSALRDNLQTAYELLIPQHDTTWSVTSFLMRVVDGTGTPFVTLFPTSPIVGTNNSEDMPKGMAAVAFYRAITGAPNRGWNMISGAGENLNTAIGEIASAYVTALFAWAAEIVTMPDVNSKAISWVIARLTGSPQNVAAHNLIASINVRNVWHFLKSRVT